MATRKARKIAEHPAPDEARAQRLLVVLGELGLAITEAIDRADHDLPSGNTPVLVLCLLDLEGPLRPGAIMAATGLSSGGVTKVVDRLEASGFVERAYGTLDDHRGVLVSLTNAGRAAARAYARIVLERLDQVRITAKELTALFGPT